MNDKQKIDAYIESMQVAHKALKTIKKDFEVLLIPAMEIFVSSKGLLRFSEVLNKNLRLEATERDSSAFPYTIFIMYKNVRIYTIGGLSDLQQLEIPEKRGKDLLHRKLKQEYHEKQKRLYGFVEEEVGNESKDI